MSNLLELQTGAFLTIDMYKFKNLFNFGGKMFACVSHICITCVGI